MAWIFFFILQIFPIQSGAMPSKNHAQCSAKELMRKDCSLSLGKYKVQISKVKITWNDGTWASIGDLPMPGDNVEWEKITFAKIGDRFLLQFWIWDPGNGQPKVQSLHWLVGELKDRLFTNKLNQLIRKREVLMTTPVSYSYDRLVPHSLKETKGTLKWQAGRLNGSI
jgi:hypothetical protein